MDDTTIFYILGLGLVGVALIVSAIGLRKEDFPSPRALKIGLPPFAVLVLATMVFAVLNSRAEFEHTEENRHAANELNEINLTAGEQEADEPGGPDSGADAPAGGVAAQPTSEQDTAPGNPVAKLTVRTPESGELEYLPTSLSSKPGLVEIDYDNPSPVPHNIVLEDPAGEILDDTQPAGNETFAVSAELKPGTYVYFCSVPGHREAGMKGKLVVK